MPAGRPPKKIVTENPPTEPEYGQTGYGMVLHEEGKSEVEGNFITDEDLAEYNDYKAKNETFAFVNKEEMLANDKQLQELKNELQTHSLVDNNELHQMRNIIKEHMEQIDKGQFVTNDEAAEYRTLKANQSQKEAEELQKKEAAAKADEAKKQAAINKLGENPVKAKNVDGQRETIFTRKAWDETPYERKDGQETNVKSGGWIENAVVPPEIQQYRNNA